MPEQIFRPELVHTCRRNKNSTVPNDTETPFVKIGGN